MLDISTKLQKNILNSADFEEKVFRKLAEEWDEGPRLDYKERVYKCVTDEEKFEFVRDMIAFANIARHRGERCWILFGVQDKTKSLIGIADQFPGHNPPKGWNNPNVPLQSKQNGIEEQFRAILNNWIDPTIPGFSWNYGIVDDVFVGYLEILPTPSSQPFFLKKSGEKRGHTYPIGSVFIRQNSSTVLLAQSEIQHLLAISDAAYLGKSEWMNLIESHIVDPFEKMDQLQPYVEHKFVEFPAEGAIDIVLRELDQNSKIIIIEGRRGEGKTVLLYRIAYNIAKKLEYSYVKENSGDSDEKTDENVIVDIKKLDAIPQLSVPIFMSLRTTFSSSSDLNDKLGRQIADYLSYSYEDYLGKIINTSRLFNIPGSRWILHFDALDELRNLSSAGPIFRAWLETLPDNVQVVMTTRPYAISPVKHSKRLKIQPLSPEEVVSIFEGKLLSNLPSEMPDRLDSIAEVSSWLEENKKELIPLLVNFRAMDGLVNIFLPQKAVHKPSIDIDTINLEKQDSFPAFNTPIPDSKQLNHIPKIDMNELVNNDNSVVNEGKYSSIDNSQENEVGINWALPLTAVAIQAITDYIQDEEIKRHKDFGSTSEKKAIRARTALRKIAWETNWEKDNFSFTQCQKRGWINDEETEWNENVGFIYRYSNREENYRFMERVVRSFLAAEYGYHEITEGYDEAKCHKAIITKIKRNLTSPFAQEIARMFNQLNQSNGRKGYIQEDICHQQL
jgi:hypothetical protein